MNTKTLLILILLSSLGQMHARTNFYDDGNRLTHSVSVSGSAIRYTYDIADNITKIESLSVPKAPSQLTATRTTLDKAKLTWQDNATTEAGFQLQRRTSDAYDWQDIIILTPNETTYTDVSLDSNINYVYRLLAIAAGNDGLTSAYSNTTTAAGRGSEAFEVSEPSFNGDQLQFSFQTEAKELYFIEWSASLQDASWQPEPFATSVEDFGQRF